MKRSLTIIRLVTLVLLPLLTAKPAYSADLPRPALLTIARDFVSRIGQKLQPANDAERAMNSIPDNELLLFRPRLGGEIIIDGEISSIKRQGQLFISLREFCQTLYLPMQVDPEKLTARGWYIREENTFAMDLNQGFVQSRGQRFEVNEDEWFRQDDDLYVSTVTIQKWMQIATEPSWDVLLLDMVADAPFPIEERNLRRKRKLDNQKIAQEPQLPRADNPYAQVSVPNADVSISQRILKNEGEIPKYSRTHSISTSGDLLGLTTRAITSGSNRENIDSLRFTMGKRSENPDLLGPLKAREFIFGDIDPADLALTGGSEQELGARVTNSVDGITNGATSRTFEGDIPPDWDVELYNATQLIGFQTVGPEGRYRFQNVDLYSGDNDFRLVFYGPQGEIREETVSIPIDIADIGKQGTLYDISLSMSGTQTYVKEPDKDVDMNTPHLVVTFDQGIADGLSLNGGLQARQAKEKWKAIGSLGGVARFGKTLLNATLATDEEMEMAFQGVARRPFGKHDARASAIFETSKFDPENTGGEATSFDGDISLRGPLAELFGQKLSYEASGGYREQAAGTNRFDGRLSFNYQAGRLNIGNSFEFQRFNNDTDPVQEFAETTTFRTAINNTRLNGGWRYRFFPDREWDSVFMEVGRNLTNRTQAKVKLTRDINPDLTTVETSLNWATDDYVLSPRISYDSTHDMQATLNMRFGLTYDEKIGKIDMRRESLTAQGAVSAFVYLDKDGNKKFDGADEPLEDARVLSVQLNRSVLTDAKGHAFIPNLPEYEPSDIVVDASSLNDPYYVVGFEGKSVYPRPGAPVSIDFPIHLSGEIDGYVYKPGRSPTPDAASGLNIRLVNERGESTFTSMTAFDGYYVISTIPPGNYLLMIEPNDLDKSGYRQPLPKLISIGYDGQVVSEQNIMLETGGEVPLTFAITRKGEPAPAQEIHAEFGQYRSDLLASIVKLRLKLALRQAGVKATIEIVPEQVNRGRVDHKLQARFDLNQFNEARKVCATLIGRGLTCRLNVPPSMFMEPKITASKTQNTQG